MTDRELMQMALDAMESFEGGTNGLYTGEFAEERKALRERLYGKWEPQIEQLYTPKGDLISISIKRTPDGPREQIHPKREWVGLTDEELLELGKKYYNDTADLMFATEAKLKEKNT